MSEYTIAYTTANKSNLPAFVDTIDETSLEGLLWTVQDVDNCELGELYELRDNASIDGIKPGNNPGGSPNG